MLKLGIIGCGYWGPNLLRNFHELPRCKVAMVCDLKEAALQYVHKKYPAIKTTQRYTDLFTKDIDAVVIATEAATHYPLAKEILRSKKHVFIEKPMAMLSKQARELIQIADKNGKIIMNGHTFVYNEAVRTLKKYIQTGQLGQLYYVYSQRLNYGVVRDDVNALWNLAPHDISILLYLLEKMPIVVSARGQNFLQKNLEDVVFITLYFPNNILVHIHVSWLDPSKVRKMTFVGSDKMVVYDDVNDQKIKIFNKGINKKNISDSLGRYDDFGKFQLIKTAGDVIIPKIHFTEPLKAECTHFIECILYKKKPLSDGLSGLRVVKVLEAAQRSLKKNGKNVRIINK